MEIFDVIKRAVREHNRFEKAKTLFRECLANGYSTEEALFETANATNVHPHLILCLHEEDGQWQDGAPATSGAGEPASGKGKLKKQKKPTADAPHERVVMDNDRENGKDSDKKDNDEEGGGGDGDDVSDNRSDDKEEGDEPKKKVPSFKKSKDKGESDEGDNGAAQRDEIEKKDKDFEENPGKKTNDLSTFSANGKNGDNKGGEGSGEGGSDDDIPVGKTVVLINPKEKPDFEDDDEDDDSVPTRRK